jgi:hypothetical protein
MVDIPEEDLVVRDFAAKNANALKGDAGVASSYHIVSLLGISLLLVKPI